MPVLVALRMGMERFVGGAQDKKIIGSNQCEILS